MSPASVPRLLSMARTAELLSVSPEHVASLARKGLIRTVRIGQRRRLVPREEIDRLCAEGTGEGGTP